MKPPELVRRLNRSVRNRQFILILLAMVTGPAAALGAIAFRELIVLGQTVLFGNRLESLSGFVDALPAWQIVAVPALGGLAVGLFVHFWMPGRRNRGIADVVEAAALGRGRIGAREGFGATVATAASISVGASVGREGPVVHLGATLSSLVASRLGLDRSESITLLGCGAASAVAASFNAPIAGVFFALEVVIGHYALSAFAPIVIASVTGTVISRLYFGDFPAFIVPELSIVSFWEFPAFALLGVTCAVAAVLLLKSIAFTSDVMARVPVPAWARPMGAGTCVGVIALAFPQVLGVGYEATDFALKGQYEFQLLVALMIAKTAATAVCLGGGFGGGIFSPSLFIGAMVGGAYGIVVTTVFPALSSGHSAYALVGLGAVSGAVLGAPISTILIVFELTANYQLAIAVMVAVVITTVITQQILGVSFFTWQLRRRGITLQTTRDLGDFATAHVEDVMTDQYIAVRSTMPAGDLLERVLASPHDEAYLVGENGELSGTVSLRDLVERTSGPAGGTLAAADVARIDPPAIEAGQTISDALDRIEGAGIEHMPVVADVRTGRLVGILHKMDLLAAYNRAFMDTRREERGGLG